MRSFLFVLVILSSIGFSSCNSAETQREVSSAPQAVASPSATPSAAATDFSARKSSAHSCQTAKDCRGMVPHFCKTCTNGNTGACAHWSCVENVCKISTCDITTTQD